LNIIGGIVLKTRTIILTILFAMLTLGNAAYADSGFEKADAAITNAIQEEYSQFYAESLESQKSEFHGDGKVSFHEATLGEGIAYYKLDVQGDEVSHELLGYKFPLYLEGEQVAVVDATSESGVWKIFNISNHNDFDNTIKQLESDYANQSKIELIDDKRYDLNYLYTQNNEEYINLTNDGNITPTEIMNIINESTKSSNNVSQQNTRDGAILVGGSSNLSASTSSHTSLLQPIILFGLSLLFAIPVFVLMIRKRKATSKLK
jgi:hypothetical protein